MTTPRPNPQTYADIVRLDATLAATWPTRIDRAIHVLADARSPLRAASAGTGGRADHPLPGGLDGDTATLRGDIQRAADIRRQLEQAILERDRLGRRIGRILDEWAPLAIKGGMGDTENAALWCPNHLKHGHREPRGMNQTRHCRWCSDIKRIYGAWPNEVLIDLHARGIKISATVARRELKRGAA